MFVTHRHNTHIHTRTHAEQYWADLKEANKVLEAIAVKRSCLLKGGNPDVDRAAAFIIDDFRNTKLGNITLETPAMVSKVNNEANLVKEIDTMKVSDSEIANNE